MKADALTNAVTQTAADGDVRSTGGREPIIWRLNPAYVSSVTDQPAMMAWCPTCQTFHVNVRCPAHS